ncbi:prepilin-type N-terminal cleavage/methylation domain-containing protein [Virgibacillus natechei]|uniref:Prepilin-type N-terminal cleavage/methylation domain-containing protein n=1 Tax=Virgibacillus natechei TaxID=1216297 RepID=A0ABS4IFW5_9BACI|nr:type II secretion system protein [Virgibacillus natechei]MBP1969743.1 prepilin-type N-terminal cleavage/methylation domain-containing protein [Virgibacillus natechei]UZD11463.1 type II secretion system GspH family protein [Virgibacillus natechei]
MLKNNGFTLVEVLVASSILMVVITTLVPIISLINEHQALLSERRTFSYLLHDELQPFVHQHETTIPTSYSKQVHHKTLAFQFSKENELVKGCVQWQNVKNTNEVICLYGYQE